ncbi:hypothetical protein PT201_08285 [Erysipelothrix rhusiopathiae]|nr:hypothetical protein [Erysipelothrix rhusiopathiae]
MNNKIERLEIRLSEDEKKFIVNKSKEEGFTSVTAFIKASTKKYVSLNIDTSDYLDMVNETRKIGRNINSIIRDVRYNNLISDKDIMTLESSLVTIENLLKEDKKELDNLSNSFENISTKKLISLVKKYDMEVPLSAIYDSIVEMIKDNLLYIINIMKREKWESHNIELIYRFIYNLLPDRYDEIHLSEINNDVYKYTLKIKNRKINDKYKFSEQDYIELVDIIEHHEMKSK